jgi:protein-S-isoprenylcysteine O-methyltransferase Ste14
MLMLAGTGTAMLSWASLAAITLPVLAVLLYRIRIEEELLTAQFGDRYRVYSGRTKKLIPWIF